MVAQIEFVRPVPMTVFYLRISARAAPFQTKAG
jgi:hypothetical protein